MWPKAFESSCFTFPYSNSSILQPPIPIPILLTGERQTNTQVFTIFLLNTKLTNSVVSGGKKGHIALFMVIQNHAAVTAIVHCHFKGTNILHWHFLHLDYSNPLAWCNHHQRLF